MSASKRAAEARLELQRVATHVLARARAGVDGRIGLRATPGGLGTPSFGPDSRVLRISGTVLICERQLDDSTRAEAMSMPGRKLAELAGFAEVDLDAPFSAGSDTIGIGDLELPLVLDAAAATEVLDWYRLGSIAIDGILGQLSSASVPQLWPEHFDLAVDVGTQRGRANLGVSPGDAACPVPYAYVGPWDEGRPGDPAFWNASFGAVATREAGFDSAEDVQAFFEAGIHQLGGP